MSLRAQHFLITRFNLQVAFGADRSRLDKGWMEERLRPFEACCAPSVATQEASSFRWLVLVDEKTPEGILERLRARGLADIVRLATPHTVASVQTSLEDVRDPERWLLTTRLDSDDALLPGFVSRLQRSVRPAATPQFWNMPFGYQFTLDRRELRWMVDPSSPFLSYMEPPSPRRPGTAYAVAHPWANRIAPLRQIRSAPLWVQVLHGANDVSVRQGVPVPGGAPAGLAGLGTYAPVAASTLRQTLRAVPAYVGANRSALRGAMKPVSFESDPKVTPHWA